MSNFPARVTLSMAISWMVIVSPARAQEKAKVIFFGGYASTAEQMACWQDGAERNAAFAGKYDFRGIPYPQGASSNREGAVSGGADAIARVIDEVNRHPDQRYVIVGHSSGAALADEVAERVSRPNQIELIVLDGFTPSPSLQARVAFQCWYAVSANGGPSSRNASGMINNCGANARPFSQSVCETSWCAHFVLVNKSVPADLSSETFASDGYRGCTTNLDWLAKSSGSGIRRDSTTVDAAAWLSRKQVTR